MAGFAPRSRGRGAKQRLVEDLQELAIAEAGALALHRERVDLGAAIAQIIVTRPS